jgi:hypothetical protein
VSPFVVVALFIVETVVPLAAFAVLVAHPTKVV